MWIKLSGCLLLKRERKHLLTKMANWLIDDFIVEWKFAWVTTKINTINKMPDMESCWCILHQNVRWINKMDKQMDFRNVFMSYYLLEISLKWFLRFRFIEVLKKNKLKEQIEYPKLLNRNYGMKCLHILHELRNCWAKKIMSRLKVFNKQIDMSKGQHRKKIQHNL